MKTNISQWNKIIIFLVLLLLSLGCAANQQSVDKEGQKNMGKEAWDTPSRQHIPR
jgi:hypothetical protein